MALSACCALLAGCLLGSLLGRTSESFSLCDYVSDSAFKDSSARLSVRPHLSGFEHELVRPFTFYPHAQMYICILNRKMNLIRVYFFPYIPSRFLFRVCVLRISILAQN